MTGQDHEQGPEHPWGRVAPDGTVYVRTGTGEREVGQFPEGTAEEALAFFTRRFDALAFEVQLLEQRVRSHTLSPDEARSSVAKVRAEVVDAPAVGDLDSLVRRLDLLTEEVAAQRDERRAERARRVEEARVRKEQIAAEAEQLAESRDWRHGADRLRELLGEWKGLARLDRSADDALWRRFSGARTAYTRRRKAHFAEVREHRDRARMEKERLVTEAEALSGSTEWGPTSGKYRDLMRRWKAAGPAPRREDEGLWKRFRAAQDTFFAARDAANAELDREYTANAERKEALLAEAEALLPAPDLARAKADFRRIAERWDQAGKVPRARVKEMEGRLRKVEQALRGAEEDRWHRSSPQAQARAADTVGQLEDSLADLRTRHEQAVADGDRTSAEQHAEAIATKQLWLDQARKVYRDFS